MKERSSQFREPAVDARSNICQKCGRVRRALKSGSLTGWIFADSRCQCALSTQELELKVLEPQSGDSVQFEDFEMKATVGHGGMGSVYKVAQKITGKIFAIKLMKEELVRDSVSVKRFEQEVQACMRLSHPNLVNVHGFGKTKSGQPYLIMDYIEGNSLQELLKYEDSLEVERALAIFINVCSAISEAHENNIVHRDIKPSNIMIVKDEATQEEQVRVVDFGIARVLRGDPMLSQSLTSTGEIFGSPFYMSPEQCKGEEVDTRSDIYSLGCVLYEMLSGKPPFQGKNPVQTILKHINDDEPDSLTSKKLGISASLNNVLLKCLAKDPRDRYANVDQLRRDLKYIRAGLEPDIKIVKSKRRRTREQRFKLFLQICIVLTISISTICFSCLWTFKPDDIESVSQSINENPNDVEGYIKRAQLYAQEQQYRKAISDLNLALRIQPDSYNALQQRANVYNSLKDYSKALKDATAAIELRPDFEMPYIERAQAYYHLRDYQASVKDSTKALEVNPNNLRFSRLAAFQNRAETYYDLRDYARSLRDSESALALVAQLPQSESQNELKRRLLTAKAKALLGLRRPEEALAVSKASLLCDGKSPDAIYWHAEVLKGLGRFADADKDMTTLVEMMPKSDVYYNQRANNNLAMGQLDKAIQDIAKAIEIAPAKPDYYLTRGTFYYGSAAYKNAIADLNQFVELANWKGVASINALLTEYCCYARLKDRAGAKRVLTELVPKVKSQDTWTTTRLQYLEDKMNDKEFLDRAPSTQKAYAEQLIASKKLLNGDESGTKRELKAAAVNTEVKKMTSESKSRKVVSD